jgi:1-deoxy-D-xylulose-5-phosphate reductoisomerase
MKSVSIVGSTGSIGTQTIDVISRRPDLFKVHAIGAYSSVDVLAAQAQAMHPEVVALGDATRVKELQDRLPAGTTLITGDEAFAEMSWSMELWDLRDSPLPLLRSPLEGDSRLPTRNH